MNARFTIGLGALALLACTQDYGQFGFGGGGGAGGSATTTSSTTSGSGGASTTTTTSSGGGDGGAGGSTTSSTSTSSGGGMGGDGGAPPVVSVACDGTPCDIVGSQLCCWNVADEDGACVANGTCSGGAIPLSCMENADCGSGQTCCVETAMGGNTLTRARCQSSCTGQNFRSCKVGAVGTCPGNQQCNQVAALPTGYGRCQ